MSDIANLIENCGAIRRGQFELSNGSLMDYYIDKYAFETDPEVLERIADAISDRLEGSDVDLLAGPALGAVPLVTMVSVQLGLPATYIRLGETRAGTQARIEGSIMKGQRVAIIEDVTMTGATITETASIVEDAGGIVTRLITVVDRDEEAQSTVRDAGYELEYLVQVGDELNVAATKE